MADLSRRSLLEGLLALAAAAGAQPAAAQPSPGEAPAPPAPGAAPFRFEDVVSRARDLAAAPFDYTVPQLPEPLATLDYDGYRDIRFRPDKALLSQSGTAFRMQMFHLGQLYGRPVTINVVREGVPTPVLYQPQLFDYGRNKFPRPFPINLGFAGFRLHHPLNKPNVFDELIAFLGASYFRFLGRDQRYGLSARALAVNVEGAGEPEEFPFFREFWVDVSSNGGPERAVVYALLDGASVTGAYRFEIYPERETVVDVGATLFPRRTVKAIGLGPLTSMYFVGENDRRFADEFRPELHDSDGLLMHLGTGEWLWRPLRNPERKSVTSFMDNNPRGFGLLQRDRVFENYQDLEATYHLRPGYWVEPYGQWGDGRVELVEIPTRDETFDNIVAYWEPNTPLEAGQSFTFGYKLRSIAQTDRMHGGGKVVNTFVGQARALGSPEPADPLRRRFLIDFAGGELAYHLAAPERVEIVASTSVGEITRTFVVANEHTEGFRAAFDVRLAPGQTTDLRAFLRAGGKTLTETWTYPWTAPRA